MNGAELSSQNDRRVAELNIEILSILRKKKASKESHKSLFTW